MQLVAGRAIRPPSDMQLVAGRAIRPPSDNHMQLVAGRAIRPPSDNHRLHNLECTLYSLDYIHLSLSALIGPQITKSSK